MTKARDIIKDAEESEEKRRWEEKLKQFVRLYGEVKDGYPKFRGTNLSIANIETFVNNELESVSASTVGYDSSDNTIDITDHLFMLYEVINNSYQLPKKLSKMVPKAFYPENPRSSQSALIQSALKCLRDRGLVENLPNKGWRRV